MRQIRTFPGHDGLHKYPGHARYRAVDAHDGRNADDLISRPNKRAPTRRYARRFHGTAGRMRWTRTGRSVRPVRGGLVIHKKRILGVTGRRFETLQLPCVITWRG